jgi:hypothetical protein
MPVYCEDRENLAMDTKKAARDFLAMNDGPVYVTAMAVARYS